MLSPQQYVLAKQLGLTLWFKRSASFSIKPARVFARLGVILPQALKAEEECKIFQGMCNVLSLEVSSYWVGYFVGLPEENLTVEHLAFELQKWRPYAVLGMGSSLRKAAHEKTLLQNVHFTATYHPKELIENTSLKKKAYQDLLNLKETLSLIKAE